MIVERVKFGSRGQGSLVRYGGSPNWFSVTFADGKEHAETTGSADIKKARAVHRKRLDGLASAREGHTTVITPRMKTLTVGELIAELFGSPRFQALKGVQAARSHGVAVTAHFGSWKVGNVTAEAYDRYITMRREAGKATSTVNREGGILRSAFKLAVERKRITATQVPVFSRLPENNIRRGFFEREEFDAVVSHLETECLKDIARFGFESGWRKGEILGLRWDMVDASAGMLTLPDSKNGRGRPLPLSGELAAIMRRREAARLVTRGDAVILTDLVFHRDDGRPIGDFRNAWLRALHAAGFSHVERRADGSTRTRYTKVFHDLRRSFARDALRSGARESTIMAIGGWRTRSVFDRYSIVSGRDMADALVGLQAERATPAERPESK